MKISKVVQIDSENVTPVLSAKGLDFYINDSIERVYVCRQDEVIAKVKLVPYFGEGGGGTLSVEEVN